MDFDGVAKAGSMLGSAGTIVMDDSTCMVWMAKNLIYFRLLKANHLFQQIYVYIIFETLHRAIKH